MSPDEARNVIYSVAMPLRRGGMGSIAWHACRALHEAGALRRVIAPESAAAGDELGGRQVQLPQPFRKFLAGMNRLGWHHYHDDAFDRWAASWIDANCLFYGWLNQSLHSLRKCHKLGGRTAVDRGSLEPQAQAKILVEEYKRFGLHSNPISPLSLGKMVEEANETDLIFVPSSLVGNSYVQAGYEACKIRVNPLGVTLPDPEAIHSARNPSKGFRVCYLGQLSIQKGIPDLLEVWKKFAGLNYTLVMGGIIPPKEKAVIQPLVTHTPGIEWNGHCQDVPSLLATCDLFVLPSAQDGFGSVVLEAMASGIPVIVSDRVGAKDCIEEGKNGYIFRFGDKPALAEMISMLGKDADLRRKLGGEARKQAARYSWEAYGSRLLSHLSRINLKTPC